MKASARESYKSGGKGLLSSKSAVGSATITPTPTINSPAFTRRSSSPFDPNNTRCWTPKRGPRPSSEIFHFEYILDESQVIPFPIKLLFRDTLCLFPLENLDIAGWSVNFEIFDLIRAHCKDVLKIVNMNHITGLCADYLEQIRGAPKLRTILMHGTITIDHQVSKFMGSLASLLELDISDCKIERGSIEIMSLSCVKLRKLVCANNVGLDDECIQHIGLWVARHRSLQNISFIRCSEFTDEGILDFLGNVQPLIKVLSFEGCRALTALAIVGMRKPMRVLESLDLSSMLLGQSSFEFLSEGCSKLKVLNVSKNLEFDDECLIRIGKSCKYLETLNISRCGKITDIGIVGFMKHFEGSLVSFDLSLCVLCTTKSVVAISDHVASLTEIKLSGLSQVNSAALTTLLRKASRLIVFEMVVELRVTATHRRSLLSHVTDEALATIASNRLRELYLTGACSITNVGAAALATKCKKLLTLDISACTQVSDDALIAIGQHAKSLTYLNISGCDAHDNGFDALMAGCTHLKEFHMNGCTKVSDCGMATVACLRDLETLCARNCEYLSNAPFLLIARYCKKLKHIDIDGLDLVTVAVFDAFAKSCKQLRRLSGEHCSVSSTEFGLGSRMRLPISKPIRRACKLEDRIPPLVRFNKFVMSCLSMQVAATRIQLYVRGRVRQRIAAAKEKLRLEIEAERERLAKKQVKVRVRPIMVKVDGATPQQTNAARVLQRWCKRINGVKIARRKVTGIRRRQRAATLIQKVFRGHASRRRTWKHFARLYVFYSKIGQLAHKLLIISAARKLHRQILAVQSIARMFPRRLLYTITHLSFRKFQWKVENYCRRKKSARQALGRIVDIICLKDDSAVRIQKNFRAARFNRMVVEYPVVCGHWYRGDVAGENWSITKIQAAFRGFMCRLTLVRTVTGPALRRRSAIVIQRRVRGIQGRQYARGVRIYRRIVKLRWRVILCALPCLRMGFYAKKIQRRFRLYSFRNHRWNAAIRVQRAYRRYIIRLNNLYNIRARLERLVSSIALQYRFYKARLKRRERHAREHMAAWKMQDRLMKRLRELKRRRQAIAIMSAMHKETADEKKRLVLERRKAMIARIVARAHEQHSRRIQRAWHKYYDRVIKRRKAEENRRKLLEEAANEIKTEKKKISVAAGNLILGPIRALKASYGSIKRVVLQDPLIEPLDQPRLFSAVLKYHKKSLLQAGVTDVHFTMGALETMTFSQVQEKHKQMDKKEIFHKIDKDLSGANQMEIYLWKKMGKGVDVITEISLVDSQSRDANVRLQEAGNKVANHPNLQFQLTGICAMKHEQEGYPVNDIDIAMNEMERVALEEQGFYMVDSFSRYGLANVTLWISAKTPADEQDLYNFRLLSAMYWFDKKLLRIVKSYNYSEEDIFVLRSIFDTITGSYTADHVRVTDICEHMNIEKTKLFEWVVSGCSPNSKAELTFTEYVYLISYYIMFAKKELNQFLFACADVEGKMYFTKDGFEKFIAVIGENSGRNLKEWTKQYEAFKDRKLDYLFMGGFHKFVDMNPSVLWQPQYIQRMFAKHNLGVEYWDRKLEQYRVTRAENDFQMNI